MHNVTLKYIVKLIGNSGYQDIQDCIGKEFEATRVMDAYYIHSDCFDSVIVSNGCYLVFESDAVEIIEVKTTKEGLKRDR